MEEYYQDALLYKASYVIGDTISSSDSSAISEIAQLCIWEGGRAVYVAQGLLSILTDSTMDFEINECPAPYPFISSPETISKLDDGTLLTVYPNPTTGEINIYSGEEMKSVVLRSSSNRVIRALVPNSKTCSIDVSNYPAGVYFITAISGDRIITRQIILNK